ncbi:hypothetical protein [Paenibacillus sp. YYML68]|uniref:hypothetical protein n=1 Tax=Paenibacillus sp. YYML68 TaxID=2909250 RepID=UPI0024937E10|nr:hypothetical protein [Paenibacillus sp. YYML68]
MHSGDAWVVVLLVIAAGIWGYFFIQTKLRQAVEETAVHDWEMYGHPPIDAATELLEELGYRVLCGKRRIPIVIQVNEGETLQSRLFLDYMAERDGAYFAVKLAKDRLPMEHTGSSVRDRLFLYQLIEPKTSGVLYVKLDERKVDCYRFRTTEAEEEVD